MNWLHYLLEANLYLGVFYLGYYLFLSRETYYTLNRVYLLFSCVVSFVLPVLQLGILKPVEQPITAVNFTFAQQPNMYTPAQAVVEAAPAFTWQDALVYGYILGAVILLVVLLIKLYSLFKLTRTQNLGADGEYKVVYINQSATAFSFFNYLFIGTKVQGSEIIIRHELVHIRQKHSADIIFIEVLKIVNWFNPFIYLLQYSLKTIHEYIADEQTAVAENDALAYSSFLVNNAYGLGGSSITHSFFNYNLLKKRIIMLHQKRSGSLARLKYLVAVPICAGLLCASTLAFSKSYGLVDIAPHRIDKSNKSPQVKEPVKSLLIHQNGRYFLADKFSDKHADGTAKVYTANNLSNKDKVYLAKKGVEISVLSGVKINTNVMQTPVMEGNTKLGYRYKVGSFTHNNQLNFMVVIYEKNSNKILYEKRSAPKEDMNLLKEKYGFTIPASILNPADTAERLAPPPTPKVVKFPPPTVSHKVVKFPPPTVIGFTKNGYKFKEDGYVINDKTDFRVIITEKDGNQKEYFKSKVSDADLKLLKEKYGYTFPEMEIHTKLPPPPPAPPTLVAPKHAGLAPGVSPGSRHLTYTANTAIQTTDDLAPAPAIVVNGAIYKLPAPFKKGEQILVDASGGEHAVMYTDKDLADAIAKYGPDAKNGVIFATGKATVTVKPSPPKTGMVTPKGKIIKAKEPIFQVDSDALGRLDMMIVVRKKGC